MKRKILILSLCFPLGILAQNGITFQIETLSKPEKYLDMQSIKDIYKLLRKSDLSYKKQVEDEFYKRQIEVEHIDFLDIVAKSQLPDSLVYFGYNSFFNGMYQAYSDHRPFVLSPDMIWLLICQGFAQHVKANSEKLRHYFVDFSGKVSLIVETKEVRLDNPNSSWEKIFPKFTEQIAEYTGSEIINLLSSDFTTTTPVEKVASEITIMETMKPYFEYTLLYILCGIPELTLQGTPEDWEKILDKTKQLRKYDLKWWTKELEPVLEEFIKASQGKIDKRFWRNMFKYHSQKKYGAPKIIDGWIVKFFPYNKDGKRNNLEKLEGNENLPEEIVKVDLKYIDAETGITTPLELWAGFIGVEQNRENFALTPKIGWIIRKKNFDKIELLQKSENKPNLEISIRVKEFPIELLSLKEAETIEIEFIKKIIIPDEFANVKINNLILSGQIDKTEIERIKNMFPNSKIIINRQTIR